MPLRTIDTTAFNDDPRKEFERVAGDLPRHSKRYKNIDSDDKRSLLWNFFQSGRVTERMLKSKSIYSGDEPGVTMEEMLTLMTDTDHRNNVHSIEHVIPKSEYLRKELIADGWEQNLVNGATVNPLNFLPCHAWVNSSRGERLFDYDGDGVVSSRLADVDGVSRRFEGGPDAEGEWVPPIVSRGDIARCVVYMVLMYDLEYVNGEELRVLQQWMKQDAPSDFEKAYGEWLLDTKPLGFDVQNPFVSNPELATNDAMFERLVQSMLGFSLPPRRGGGGGSGGGGGATSQVEIDSALPNPTGMDTSGKELVSLRNKQSTTKSLNGWKLVIEVHYRSRTNTITYGLTGIELLGYERAELYFPDDNVLPNRRSTTIKLVDGTNAVVSQLKYTGREPRSGRVISRL